MEEYKCILVFEQFLDVDCGMIDIRERKHYHLEGTLLPFFFQIDHMTSTLNSLETSHDCATLLRSMNTSKKRQAQLEGHITVVYAF